MSDEPDEQPISLALFEGEVRVKGPLAPIFRETETEGD